MSLASVYTLADHANVYTLASDMFPRAAVGSVVGIGAFAGGIGGWGFQRDTGQVLECNGHDYKPFFIVSRVAYISVWTITSLLGPLHDTTPERGKAAVRP